MGISYRACREDRDFKKINGKLCEYMKIPDKSSITLEAASDISPGAKRITRGWQFGIFSNDTVMMLTLFLQNEPDNCISVEIPGTFRKGNFFSFILEFADESGADELDGVCYAVGIEKRSDVYAKEYCYSAKEAERGGDFFGRSRDELYSVLRCDIPMEKNRESSIYDTLCSSENITAPLIYKLHVRGYTKLESENGGTFAALMKKAEYIQELGMNTVLLMPCYEFNETTVSAERNNYYDAGLSSGKINYWGYTDGYYFAPKRAYCAGGNCVEEFGRMVNLFHEKSIAVLMEMWFPYDMSPVMAVEILRYWHITYGIDGFRIMGSCGLLYAVRTDMQLADCVFLGEDFGEDSFNVGAVQPFYDDKRRIIKYNDGFMEAGRHFLRGDEDSIVNFVNRVTRHDGGHPTVNFMADQNCLSLMDMVSFERRHNEYNGENNLDGRRYNISFNCGTEGKTKREVILRQRKKMIKNALAMVFLSASVPMLMAGDEFGVSHGGNNNPYCHDNDINYIDWELLSKNSDLYEFTRKLIQFRKEHSCIRPQHDFSMNDHKIKGMPDLSCHSERAWFPLMAEYSHNIGLLYSGAYAGEQANVYVLYNMHTQLHEFAVIEMAGKKWTCALSSDETGVVYDENRKKIKLAPYTMAVFVSQI